MIHINLNMIFYTHVEHSPTKTIYIKYIYITKNKKQLSLNSTGEGGREGILLVVLSVFYRYLFQTDQHSNFIIHTERKNAKH